MVNIVIYYPSLWDCKEVWERPIAAPGGCLGSLVRAAAWGHAALQLVRSAVVGGNRRCPRAAI